MSLYQRGKSWYYDFLYHGERYAGCIGPVSKTVAKEILAKKKAEAVEGWYKLPSKKPSPRLDDFSKEYFAYYQAHNCPLKAVRPVQGPHRVSRDSGISGSFGFAKTRPTGHNILKWTAMLSGQSETAICTAV